MAIDPPAIERPPKWAQVLVNAANARNRARELQEVYSMEDLTAAWEASGGCCAISGLPFSLQVCGDGQAERPFAPSLDRIDRHKPYRRDNVRIVVSVTNFAMNCLGRRATSPAGEHASQEAKPAAAVATGPVRHRARRRGYNRYGTGRDRPWDARLSAPARYAPAHPRPVAAGTAILATSRNALAERFGVTTDMRKAMLRSGCPAWGNHIAWALVDLSRHRRGTGEIERIESSPPQAGIDGNLSSDSVFPELTCPLLDVTVISAGQARPPLDPEGGRAAAKPLCYRQ
jgi:hypothetical protein